MDSGKDPHGSYDDTYLTLCLKIIWLKHYLRRQFHPDMTGLQVSLYSMTRLLAETRPGLYRHLDR